MIKKIAHIYLNESFVKSYARDRFKGEIASLKKKANEKEKYFLDFLDEAMKDITMDYWVSNPHNEREMYDLVMKNYLESGKSLEKSHFNFNVVMTEGEILNTYQKLMADIKGAEIYELPFKDVVVVPDRFYRGNVKDFLESLNGSYAKEEPGIDSLDHNFFL